MIDLEDAIYELNHNISFDGAKMLTEGECVILLRNLQEYQSAGLTPEEINAIAKSQIETAKDNANLRFELESLRTAQITHHCENCESMGRELELVKAERNAAVSDLRHYPGIAPCHICLNRRGDMKHCALGSRNCFKWRGVQKEETK